MRISGAMIRRAEPGDFDAIAAITNHYIATTTIHFAYEPVTAEALRASVRPRHPWFVAEVVRPSDTRAATDVVDANAGPRTADLAEGTVPFTVRPADARTGARVVDDARTGEVVGYAKAGPYRERAAYDWTTEIGLYIAPGMHRRGIGKALYTALLDELQRLGFRSAIAGISLPNEPSIALHRDCGFSSVGVVREAGYKLGRWTDVEFFQKQLAVEDPPRTLP